MSRQYNVSAKRSPEQREISIHRNSQHGEKKTTAQNIQTTNLNPNSTPKLPTWTPTLHSNYQPKRQLYTQTTNSNPAEHIRPPTQSTLVKNVLPLMAL